MPGKTGGKGCLAVPLNRKVFEAQIRFVLKAEMKRALVREARRRALSAADLLSEFIEEGLARRKVDGSVGRAS